MVAGKAFGKGMGRDLFCGPIKNNADYEIL
jgi:hypothetical protein